MLDKKLEPAGCGKSVSGLEDLGDHSADLLLGLECRCRIPARGQTRAQQRQAALAGRDHHNRSLHGLSRGPRRMYSVTFCMPCSMIPSEDVALGLVTAGQ